jgi:glycosyltransferase involved in cell wall biosynthesis
MNRFAMPRVSVLTTVYNGMPYLPKAVESILNQTFVDFDYIIVDDGSNDSTPEYLASLTDPRIKVITQSNTGTGPAAQHGLTYCTGEYIARMDADDYSLSTRLEEQVAYMDAHPEVGLLGCQMAPMGDKGVGRSLEMPTNHEKIFSDMMAGRHGIAHSCLLIRATRLREVGGYWTLPLQDEWDMTLKVGEISKLANLDKVLFYYRVHSGSLNGTGMRRMRFSIDYSIECARRRQQDLAPISHTDYAAQMAMRPWWKKAVESIELHARSHYRLAIAERQGDHPVRGTLRLAWAAACSPTLTIQRVARMFQRPRAAQ